MAIEIIVPRLGWSMEEGIFTEWLKQDGEFVAEGDMLFVLEGDKASQEVESFDRGILRIAPEGPQPGETVTVGQRLGYLCEEGEGLTGDAPVAAMSEAPAPGGETQPISSLITNDERPSVGNGEGSTVASPSVRRLARELGVALANVGGTGKNGRVTRRDVESAAETSDPVDTDSPPRISPRAARTAKTLGVDVTQIKGTGKTGRIRERDIVSAARQPESAAPAAGRVARPASDISTSGRREAGNEADAARIVPISKLRQTIAHRMLAAVHEAAPVTLTTTLDATEFVKARFELKNQASLIGDLPPSYTALLVRLTCDALGQHEMMTARWTDQGLVVPESRDIAVAVDTDEGLYAPVLSGAGSLSLRDISRSLDDLAERTRRQALSPEDLQGACFTITNLGMYGVDAFTPILNLPQAAILGVGRIIKQPWVVDDQVVPRDCMTLSLTFDHRVIDGAPAAAFLDTLRTSIEQLSTWALM